MSYYISRYGRVRKWEGQISSRDPYLDTSVLGFKNSFEDIDRAYYFCERLKKYHPRIFLIKEKPKMAKQIMNQDDFRELMRKGVAQHFDEFWHNLQQLDPKEFVDGYLKALQYGFSRAPMKEPDEDERLRRQDRERKRKEELIELGIQTDDME